MRGRPYECSECEDLLPEVILHPTSENTHGRDPMNVMNVGRLSARSSPSLNISELTLGRSHMTVMIVGSPSAISQPSEYIREFTKERNPMNVADVEKPATGCGL